MSKSVQAKSFKLTDSNSDIDQGSEIETQLHKHHKTALFLRARSSHFTFLFMPV